MTNNITRCLLTLALVGCASPAANSTSITGAAGQSAVGAAQAVPAVDMQSPTQPAAAAPSGMSAQAAAPAQTAAAPSGMPSANAATAAQPAQTTQTPAGQAQPAADPAAAMPPGMGMVDFAKDPRGSCLDLHTSFPDDHACIAPPPPELGFQVHVGPSKYDDPAELAKFVIKPGEEKTECYTFRTSNAKEITYQSNTLSGRAGTHHIINTTWSGDIPTGSFTEGCGSGVSPFAQNAPMQTGSMPGASKSYMPRRTVAPEFADVGRKLPANALVTSDMHYYNFTDKDILREYWINFYYPPAGQEIKRFAQDIAAFGGSSWNNEPIQPGTDMVYKYECPISGSGWITNLLGHYHLHGKRFGVSIKRKSSGMSEKVFEMYDPQDPAVFDYNSVTMNPAFTMLAAGATSGMLAVSDGDMLQWECHIINDSDQPLKYTNEVKTGEMCNTWGFSVGIMPLQCNDP